MSVVFLDASAIIYLLEGTNAAQRAVRDVLANLHTPDNPPDPAISVLSRLECRVKPIREGEQGVLEELDNFLTDPGLTVVPLTTAIIDHATELRARTGIRTPDALQAASALSLSENPHFVTGDGDFAAICDLRLHHVAQ